MHPLKREAVTSHKEKFRDMTRANPKGHDIRETYREETHPSTDRLREAQSLPERHEDKMPKAMVRSKYGDV
jgi:hypothetical protein